MAVIDDARCYWTPKHASHVEDWKDACAVSERSGRLAVADGASNRSFASHQWARHLVQRFIASPPPAFVTDLPYEWIDAAAGAWLARRNDAGDSLTRAAFDEGSFATLLGLQVLPGEARGAAVWDAIAVGDTCLFHIRDDRLLEAFPIADPDSFNDRPALVASTGSERQHHLKGASRATGVAQRGDYLVVTTDALAQWSLATGRFDPRVWRLLCRVQQEELQRLVGDARSARSMTPDDVTLARCRVAA